MAKLENLVYPKCGNLRGAIQRAANRGVVTFISGGVLGVDQWAAVIVIEMRTEGQKHSPQGIGGIKLIIARPFLSQPNRWPTEARRHYEKRSTRFTNNTSSPMASWSRVQRKQDGTRTRGGVPQLTSASIPCASLPN